MSFVRVIVRPGRCRRMVGGRGVVLGTVHRGRGVRRRRVD